MTVDAIVRARMSSSRLPGKTLLVAAGKTMLEHTVERIRRSDEIGRVVVATSLDSSDDPIVALCASVGIACFRGDLDDVLGRVVACAAQYSMADVAHFSPDNPLVDSALTDSLIRVFVNDKLDYATNNLPPTWPDGLEVEVTTAAALRRCAALATTPRNREHFLTWIWEHADDFRVRNITRTPSLNGIRLTLDYPEDWERIRLVFDELYPANPRFDTDAVLALLDGHSELFPGAAGLTNAYPWRE